MEDQDFGPDIVTLSDDDGNEFTFEMLDAIETDDGRYVALLPIIDDPADIIGDSGQLVILKATFDETGEEVFDEIDDDDEYDTVADLFTDRLQDIFEIEEDDEEDGE